MATLLARRAAALLAHDRAAWLDTVAATPAARSAQSVQFQRISALPVTRWQYHLDAFAPTADPSRASARVTLTYRLAGDSRDVVRSRILALGGPSARRVVSETAAAGTDRELWDVDALTVARVRVRVGVGGGAAADEGGSGGGGSGGVAVVLGPASPFAAPALAASLDAAVWAVDAVWGLSWPRGAVVVLPADQGQFAALLGRADGPGPQQLAAVTTGRLDRGGADPHAVAGAADRVVLNPGLWTRLTDAGRQAVLVHELTHIATRATTVATPPAWLEEGFAAYVGFRAAGLPDAALPASVLAADALTQVRARGLPAQLPADPDFDPAGTEAAAAYAQAWVACELVAERAGPRAPARLYRAASSGVGGQAAADAALRQVLGEDTAAFTLRWRTRLRALAGGGG